MSGFQTANQRTCSVHRHPRSPGRKSAKQPKVQKTKLLFFVSLQESGNTYPDSKGQYPPYQPYPMTDVGIESRDCKVRWCIILLGILAILVAIGIISLSVYFATSDNSGMFIHHTFFCCSKYIINCLKMASC